MQRKNGGQDRTVGQVLTAPGKSHEKSDSPPKLSNELKSESVGALASRKNVASMGDSSVKGIVTEG